MAELTTTTATDEEAAAATAATAEAEKAKGTSATSAPKTFTQEEVNRMLAAEKKQGRSSALTELGVTDANVAKQNLANYQKFLDSQKSEQDIANDKLKQEATDKAEATQRAEKAEAKVEAMMLGVKPDCVDDVITLAMGKVADGSDFKTVIAEIKTKYPTLFTDSVSEDDDKAKQKKAGQKGTGGVVKAGSKKAEETESRGARLAAARKGPAGEKKNPYFSK